MENNFAPKIIHVISRMNVGGPARMIQELMHIDKSVAEQFLITGICQEGEIDFRDSHPELHSIELKNLGRDINLISDLINIIKIGIYLRKLKPDYVITHAAKAGFSGRLAAMLFYPRAQRIHFFHGHLLYGYFSKPVSYIFKLIEKYIGKFTHKIVAIGSGVQKDLIINGVIDAEKIYVLLPGVKLNIIQSKHLNEKGFNILFVGRLTAIKNPFRVVRLAQLAKDQKLSMKFQVVGGGELLEKLLKTKNDLDLTNLEFYNWQNDLAQFYLQSNLVICTSLNEGVPLALIEATQFGNPIISMSVGSVGDIVKNNYNGFLIEDFDLDFFEYLRKLYEDKELLATFRSNSLEIYKSFTPENMKSKFIEIIQS